MASVTISTPSPPGSIRTPDTPKHGYSDSWEPFSPRKSARISARQQSTNRTPSPRSSLQFTRPSTKPSFTTPAVSPIKKRLPKMDSVRRASSSLTAQGHASAADSLGIKDLKPQHKPQGSITASRSAGDLLTPTKTPRKQPNAKTEAASRAMARRLFVPEEDIMPSPKKKAKRYTGLTLDSFRAENMEEDIQIFTDSRDDLPQLDDIADNPFYGDRVVAEPSKRRSKRKQVVIPGEGRHSIEDAVKRDDGVLYVFRGKKIFRKFSDVIDADSSSQAENDETADLDLDSQAPSGHRPMTRSSIKPRLLFPPKPKGKQPATITAEDEEAVTDIEDNVFDHNTQDETEIPATPIQFTKGKVETPEAPRFAPASPPSTGRATRSADKLRVSDTPVPRAKIPSPFDGWRRSKRHTGPQGSKREGDFLVKSPASTKRQRA
ncbi:hypothetical protein FHL15_003563 [Xylaria flabelliformis]|uniref:Uncharacterized protein n=1 Tax=Xylaria flabelliformis TaxID=2512241 RepID=A0A553I5Y4_9PEZI|nr:hypothetical protein FHL15_003563 [Xylaria flabelliformis]